MRRERGGGVLLRPEAVEGADEDARAGGLRDLGGPVRRRGVDDDDDLVGERDGGERLGEAVLLVARDERDREGRAGRRRASGKEYGPSVYSASCPPGVRPKIPKRPVAFSSRRRSRPEPCCG